MSPGGDVSTYTSPLGPERVSIEVGDPALPRPITSVTQTATSTSVPRWPRRQSSPRPMVTPRRPCASCAHLRFSGMSHQMSAGTRGYCTRVGFRNARAGPDRSLLRRARGGGRLAGRPGGRARGAPGACRRRGSADRGPAFAGAMIGLGVGDALGFPAEFRTRTQIVRSFGAGGLDDLVALHDPRWPGTPVVWAGGIRPAPSATTRR
jgi:hypothetical protein